MMNRDDYIAYKQMQEQQANTAISLGYFIPMVLFIVMPMHYIRNNIGCIYSYISNNGFLVSIQNKFGGYYCGSSSYSISGFMLDLFLGFTIWLVTFLLIARYRHNKNKKLYQI